ncbi:hypothetical protein GGX14DRAFT_580447 [Mycena pura]|uniref:Uncharacterized protein n=1 Tax=Mycena pura TaxID=153505 RepID=A0AAD6Y3A2_9AGAR|nr:hypothetical protein GGX14DRAFT_580447 [Mycena pura]
MFFVSLGLLMLAAASVATPTPQCQSYTGEEAVAAGLLKIIPGDLANLNLPALAPSPEVFSNGIWLWNTTGTAFSGLSYNPGTDTVFNDMAQSFFVATDTSCNLFISAGCTGTSITDAPRGDFVVLTGIFDQFITSFSCEWQDSGNRVINYHNHKHCYTLFSAPARQ